MPDNDKTIYRGPLTPQEWIDRFDDFRMKLQAGLQAQGASEEDAENVATMATRELIRRSTPLTDPGEPPGWLDASGKAETIYRKLKAKAADIARFVRDGRVPADVDLAREGQSAILDKAAAHADMVAEIARIAAEELERQVGIEHIGDGESISFTSHSAPTINLLQLARKIADAITIHGWFSAPEQGSVRATEGGSVVFEELVRENARTRPGPAVDFFPSPPWARDLVDHRLADALWSVPPDIGELTAGLDAFQRRTQAREELLAVLERWARAKRPGQAEYIDLQEDLLLKAFDAYKAAIA